MSQFKDWEDFIKQLEDKEAYDTELKKIKECGSFETFFKHENIFDWLGWIIDNCLYYRWLEAEPIIMTDAWCSYCYARDVLKRSWPETEPIIMTKAWCSYCYARHVLKRRWPEAEPIIMKNALSSYFYARDVLKGRWPEAEPIIMTDIKAWEWYSAWKEGINESV